MLLAAPEPFATPGVRTIEDLVAGYQAPADRQIKTLVYFLDDVLTLVLLRGDHALNEQKLIDATGATAIRPAQPEEIRAALGALPGSLGAVGRDQSPGHRRRGAARPARHVHRRQHRRHPPARGGRRAGHQRRPVGRPARGGAAASACVNCGHGLEVQRGIEVGHIFKLGYKYTDAMQIRVSGPDGKPVKPTMGCYGIGVERAMATVVEVHYDDKGIIWPVAIAPFEAVVVIAQQDDAGRGRGGHGGLPGAARRGRGRHRRRPAVRAGVKFSDAELVGIPFRVTVGKRGLADGTAEITERAAGSTVRVPLADLAQHVREDVAKSIAAQR